MVVRRDWATSQARLAQIAVGAFTQTPGVTYDIPLARVVTVGGFITEITDLREYCRYSGEMQQSSVVTNYVATGAITPAKLVNQTRFLTRGGGALIADTFDPATRANVVEPYTHSLENWREDAWQFSAVDLNAVWAAFRVPEDIVSATMTVYIHVSFLHSELYSGPKYQRWGFYTYSAQPSAAFANATDLRDLIEFYGGSSWDYWNFPQIHRYALGSFAATAGDIVSCQIYRDGSAAQDTSISPGLLYAVEFSYTADS